MWLLKHLFSFWYVSYFPHQALSVAQLEALGPDNAAMVTTEQRAALKDDQRAVLDRAETGTVGQSGQQTQPAGSSKKTSVLQLLTQTEVRFF